MKRKILSLLLIFQFVFAGVVFASGKDDYSKGWTEFSNNNRSEARKYFEQALADPEVNGDALLSLCLLDWSEYKLEDAFVGFQKFYQTQNDPNPYLYAFFSSPFLFNGKGFLRADKLAFCEKIVNDPNLNGTLKAMLNQQLGYHYQWVNNNKRANECFSKVGALDNWQVLGTFNNTSGSGFSKDWGAVKNAKPGHVFKNKVDADITWYTPGVNKPDHWFYFDYYFSLDNIIVYAQTFVNSPVDQDVYLRAGTSGSLKIWVNDNLTSSIVEERNCDLDIYAYKVPLQKGTNRILVEIGQSEISAANFLVRLTDENANPVPGLTHQAAYADYTKQNRTTESNILPFFAEDYFEKKIKSEPDNIINYLALGETYLRNDKSHEATSTYKVAERSAPKFSLLQYRLAESYIRAKNQTDYSREMGNIKLVDPDCFFSLQQLFDEAIQTEKFTEAENISQKVKNLYGENTATENWDVMLASHQKRVDDWINLVKKLYAKYPYSSSYMELNYLIEDNIFKNTKAATAIVENYCKKYYSSNALEILSKRYFSQGSTDKGLDVLRQRIKDMPYATGYLFNFATMLYNMQKYKEALDITDNIIKLGPYLPGVYNTRGYIYRDMKDAELAKENFRKSIYYGPTSYDSRTQLRLLENKKEVTELFPSYNLDSLIAKAPTAADFPEDGSVILLNDNHMVYYPEGAKEYRVEIAIKILNQSGIENWKEYGLSYNGNSQKLILNKYEVIKANGQKVKAETDNTSRVVFTNAEIGDVIHLDYRVQDYSSGVLAKHFFDQLLLKYAIPSALNRYCILAPADKKFDHIVTNGDVKPIVTDIENMKLYQWISENQPAVKPEPYMGNFVDAVPTLTFSSIPDWKFVSDWYKDLTANKFKTDYVLKETMSEILKGKENTSKLEKAELFYEYILKNITYSNVPFMQSNLIPQKASRTISTRLGDCKDVSTLFVAFCRESGIDANLVLLDSRDNGKNNLALPSINFNHCIAQLNIDGKVYYLELTDNKLPFGAALEMDLHSNILPIPFKDEPIGSKLLVMDMPFRPLNVVYRIHDIKFNNDDMFVSMNSIRYGSFASGLRQLYADVGREEQLKQINQSVAADFSVPVKVSNVSFVNLDNLADSVICKYDIEIKNAMQEVAGMKIFKLPWSEGVISLEEVAPETRKYSLDFWWYVPDDVQDEKIILILPQGKKFVEIPKNVKIECTNASYELRFDTKKSGEVIVKRIFKRKTESVSPEEYTEFRNFMHAVSQNDNKQYAIN